MIEQILSTEKRRQRKFLMMLPVLVLPFLTLLFWALGGGTSTDAAQMSRKGLNVELPDARFEKNQRLDKMHYYDAAAADSATLQEMMRTDPFYSLHLEQPDTSAHTKYPTYRDLVHQNGRDRLNVDPNEDKVYRKLAELEAAMNQPAQAGQPASYASVTPGNSQADIDRLEQMMQAANDHGGADPEIDQINTMLESILDIQHPERVQERQRRASEAKKGQVFAVSRKSVSERVSTLQLAEVPEAQQNGFFSLDALSGANDHQNAVAAVIHEDQSVVAGSTIKLRLTGDIYINGVLVPAGHFVFGTVALSGERLSVKIDGIRFRNSLFPVALSVYDMDGLEGIHIPGAISRDVAKSSADRSIQNIGMTTLDPSLGAQAAGAGIEAVRSLFSRKVKLVKVMVKAGYKILLKDEKQRQNEQ